LPARVDAVNASFTSLIDLASALRRAAAAHVEHEKRTNVQTAFDFISREIVKYRPLSLGKTLPSR
jgi:hypothetical protein